MKDWRLFLYYVEGVCLHTFSHFANIMDAKGEFHKGQLWKFKEGEAILIFHNDVKSKFIIKHSLRQGSLKTIKGAASQI